MRKFLSMLCGFCAVLAFQANAPAQAITNQPQSITINIASTAMFTVGASNATTYQWQLNGTNLSDTGTNLYAPGSISGSTTSTLTLENVTTNEAGNYTVVINNGATNSAPAVLNLVPGTIVTFTLSGLLTNAPGSNITVQLFDHDKPATVANFLHYIRSGAFSNMFFDVCSPGLSLNGGYYGTSNRTDTNSPPYGWDILNKYADATNQNPPFPVQIASEYNNGPLIQNDFGTLTMILQLSDFGFGPALENSARNGFVFNLGDNSSLLNVSNREYTAFGRVISGTNVLQYFNGLTDGNGIISSANFVDQGTNLGLGSLPVNYTGTNAPANANLVYCDFNWTTNIPVDMTSPTVVITSPTAGALLTNGPVIQGAASDNVAVAVVNGVLTPQQTDGIYANGGVSMTNYAVGTTNWTITFSDPASTGGFVLPGTYDLIVQSQDGAGNLSLPASQLLTVTAIAATGIGTVSFQNSTNNPIGYPFQEDGSTNEVQAVAGTNQIFVSWSATNFSSGQNGISYYPILSFIMSDGLLLTANFISNDIPNSIAISPQSTNPVFSGVPFNITGAISNGLPTPVTVSCTIFSTNTGFAATPALTTMLTNIGMTNWSVTVTNSILPGAYIIQAVVVDQRGESTLVQAPLTISDILVEGEGSITLTQGTTVITNPIGYALQNGVNYTVKAIPAAGQTFVSWTYGDFITASPTLTFGYSGGLLTATFIPTNHPRGAKGIAFTYPPANAKIMTNSFLLKGTIAPSVKSAQVTCQISSLTTGLKAGPTLTASGTNTWSVAVSNLAPDTYVVEAVATNATGFSTVIAEEFSVLDFKGVAGTYSGLFICTNSVVTPTNSGFFTFTVSPGGGFTGRLLFPAYGPLPISASFYAYGSIGLSYAGFKDNPIIVNLALDLTNGTDTATGRIYSASNTWSSQLICYRAVTKLSSETTPATGKYVLDLPFGSQTNDPETNGYASFSVGGTGVLTLDGALPDGASFSQSARVSKNGVWPLYAVPAGYRGGGMLMGWETNQASGNCSGQLYWYKASHIGAYYTNGVGTNGVDPNVNSTGTNYVRPAPGNYSIVFQGGTISVPMTNALTVNDGGQFVVPRPAPADKLAISLSASGVITGHFVTPDDNKPLQFKGAFFGRSQGGSGFILDGNGQTGTFLLESQ